MKKKVLSVVLSVCILLCMFSTLSFASETILEFDGNDVAEIGDAVEISLKLTENPGIISLSLDISYDKDALKLVNVEDCALLKGYNSSSDYENVYPYTLFWLDGTASSNNKQTGVVAKLTFEVLESGNHEVDAICNVNDTCKFSLDSVDFGSASHLIKVNGEEEPPTGYDEIFPEIPEEEPDEGENSDDVTMPSVELTKNTNGMVDDTATVSVNIKSNPGIISAKFYVDYDKEALMLIDVEDTELLKGFNSSPDYEKVHPYSLFWLDGTATRNNKEIGTIAKLTFKIIKDGNHTVKITCEPRNTNNILLEDVDFGCSTGTVNAVKSGRIKVNVSEDDFDYLVNIKVENMPENAFVYVAAYSENKRMRYVSPADSEGNATFDKNLSIDYFKTFLWSADGIPLVSAIVTNLN